MNKTTVNKALTADEKPTPGYLYKEIADMTHASIQDCEKLATLLIARLAKNDCNVKYKTLLVIKHVARLGRSEFKRLMQRQVDTLKQNLQFRGPPHPLKGDAPNKRVRDTAEEAIKAVFESESASTAQSAAVASRMTGLGSDGTTSAAAGAAAASPAPAPVRGGGVMRSTASPASGGSGMAAVGNYSPKAKPAGGGMLGAVKGLFSRATGKGTPPPVSGVTNRGPTARGGAGAYAGPSVTSTGGSTGRSGASSMARGGGPGARRGVGSVGGVWGVAGTSSPGGVGAGASDGEYERGLVADVTAPGGVRPVPDAAKLRAFVTAAQTLEPVRLAALLDERLTHESWQVVTKALLVVQALVQAPGCAQHKAHLADHCDEILALHDDATRESVRKAAAQTLSALGVDYSGAPAAGGGGGGDDLLGFGAPAPAPAEAPTAEDEDIFGGMSFGTPAPAPAPASAPAAGGDDIFGGMSFGAPAPAPAPTPAASGFTFNAPAPADSPAPAPAASGFSFTAPAPAPAPINLAELYSSSTPVGETGQSSTPGVSPPTVPPASGGFSFASAGQGAAPSPAPSAAVGGFSFTAPAPAPAPAPAGTTLASGASTRTQAPAPAPAPADPFAGLMGDL